MQLATATALRKKWPNSRIIISAPFPHYDARLYKDFELIKSNRRRLIYSTLALVTAHVYSSISKLGINPKLLLWNQEMRTFKEADIVIDLSGDTITEDYGPHVTYSHLLPLLLAHALKTPVYICAQSMGPFKLTRWLVGHTLRKCAGVTAREKVTFDYLKSISVPSKILNLESDMAFLLKPAPGERVAEILRLENINFSTPTLGVTVSGIIRNRFNSQSPESFDSFFARFIDHAIKKYNLDIVFIGHVTGPSEDKDDRLVAQRIHEHIEQKDRVSILRGNYSPSELKGVISRCDLFLGARMHSNIGAISTHVPTIAMSYSHKTIGIMGSVGMEDYVFSGDKLNEDELINVLGKAKKNSKKIRGHLSETIPNIQASSRQNIKNIERVINQETTDAS